LGWSVLDWSVLDWSVLDFSQQCQLTLALGH
jgi:hypothetical protein